ncbi:MAG: DEAD/DEAH box helicase family protein [Anaerolineaceae bacterium]|nr:DEAD/DEAH box helicase family protein [Anaerolineaceae bacterium]
MTIKRFSSRTERLDQEFLAKTLQGASKYYRIAGYFRSSIFELVGEEISQIPEVKIVCNSELDFVDFNIATGRDTKIKEHWNQVDVEAEAILKRDRYQTLDQLLKSGNVEVRVVPKERLFLHGKAGSIHYPDGTRKSFVGSVNESKSAFSKNYELVWQDDDEASADWVEKEFWALWEEGVPLPEAIMVEIHRVANRREVTIEVLRKTPEEAPAAVMAEAPIYRGGEQLQSWQRSFVAMFIEHRKIYGKVRLLLADEVGVGKTLSMATCALINTLLEEKRNSAIIFAPSTLIYQWQIEIMDRLGVPTAVWSSQKKAWIGVEGQILSPQGEYQSIKKCPYKIAIVSTGLLMHQRDEEGYFIKEAEMLLSRKYGLVILDEAHKARTKKGLGTEGDDNNLRAFMLKIAKKTQHMILGTATPIQTEVSELWDLLEILNTNAEFVLGDALSPWRDVERAIPMVTGETQVKTTEEAWQWICNPLPPGQDDFIIDNIRNDQNIAPDIFQASYQYNDLSYLTKDVYLPQCLVPDFFQNNNPILRHTVVRKRKQLEDQGLMIRVGVSTHPLRHNLAQYNSRFVDLGVPTNSPFQVAYEQAEKFSKLLQTRTRSAGFMKSLLLQRICSSFVSGRATAYKMLQHSFSSDDEIDDGKIKKENILTEMTPAEAECLQEIIIQMDRNEAIDPKLKTIKWFLTEFHTEGKTWLEHGCIVFSQYYDTVEWIASEIAKTLPDEVVAVYAGGGKSGLYKGEDFNNVDREVIKAAVGDREIRLVIATDAACEGLNLQTLGTLINIDLPWNPSRLEQRLGRIKRFGQARKMVDMLNLVYSETQDEKIYGVLSERLKGTYDIFGSLPDTIRDEWIESEEELKERIDAYIHERESAQNAFSVKYGSMVDPKAYLWERCAAVLSRRDIVSKLSEPW